VGSTNGAKVFNPSMGDEQKKAVPEERLGLELKVPRSLGGSTRMSVSREALAARAASD